MKHVGYLVKTEAGDFYFGLDEKAHAERRADDFCNSSTMEKVYVPSLSRAASATAAPAPDQASDERAVIKSLEEPVSVEKAMLAGRLARAETSVQGSVAVFLVNIQIAGWCDSKEYAEDSPKASTVPPTGCRAPCSPRQRSR
ncbi:hypothetical protein AU476_07395 [Cupriavidus sp. UYMSc13B]|nr:hypothetical protein AU476_07395 [Cupriavidus sp. UYMSc13B]